MQGLKLQKRRIILTSRNQWSVNTVDYKDAIVCIKAGHYEAAANYMVKEALGDKSLWRGDLSPDQIADEAYLETVEELGLDAPDLSL
jgi:hypothetical protein